jgi:thiamine biosynthesis lipoprotein
MTLDSAGADAKVRRSQVSSSDFRAMATKFTVTLVGGDETIAAHVQQLVTDLEAKWTRFDDSSELMALNNRPGEWVPVSSDTIRLVQAMVDGWRLTGHVFSPNMLAPMLDLGFAASSEDPDRVTRWSQRIRSSKSMNDIRIDADGCRVWLPRGVGLDAGGIGKGLAADMMAEQAMAMGVAGVAVFAGGEVRVCGAPPDHHGWRIGVEHPEDDDLLIDVLELEDGGVATSGTSGWVTEHGHHIVDPRTGRSTDSGSVQATAVTGECVDAEIVAKACIVLDPQSAIGLAHRLGAEALIIDRHGHRHATEGWDDLCS